MKSLKTISKGYREFELIDQNNTFLGKIVYPKWYSYNAEIHTQNGISEIKMEGFWQNKVVQFDVNKNAVRHFKNTWRGFAIEEENGKKYFLSTEGFLNFHFVLKDENENDLMTIRSNFKWKELKSEYLIEIEDSFQPDSEFLLAIIHCTNYMMHMISAAAAV